MTSAKLFFGSNIRFLRERRKLTQEDFAERLGITRVKLAAIEGGRTENPSAVDLIKFSDFFGLSIDNLFRLDLRRVGELPLRELEAGNQLYMKGTNLRVLAISTDKANKENVEYVPIKAKAGYRSGYANPEFIASLPKFSVPGLPQTGTFRMFPTTGDSMLPVPEGADVICRYVEDWTMLKPGTLCIVILDGEQDFVFKKVTVLPEGKKLLLESLNRAYEPYEVSAGDVIEIWKFHSYFSKDVPERGSEVQHISQTMDTILRQLQEIQQKIENKTDNAAA